MKKRIIFDFDGVLADSLSVTMDNINFLSKNFFKKIPLVNNQNDMSCLFNIKLRDSLLKYGYNQLEIKDFFDRHTSMMCQDANKILVFKDIINFILISKYHFSIVSSSYLSYIEIILNNFSNEALKTFDEILGRERKGSKAEKIKEIIFNYNLNKDEVLYVGDTSSDILTCKEIGVDIIAVGYGFHPFDYLLKFKPEYCVKDERQLINLLNVLCDKAA